MKKSRPAPQTPAKASTKDIQWYDEFYRKEQRGLPPWYRFLLPELEGHLKPHHKLIELGCGQAHVLRLLVRSGVLPEENITGVDQSRSAVEFSSQHLPKAKLVVDDIYHLNTIPSEGYDVCLLMETIEHLEQPGAGIASIHRVLKPGATLFMSFPNYLHLPWLAVRVLAEKLNRPNWVVLQPVDKIYTVFSVIRMFEEGGFEFRKGIGCNYGPPVLYPLETDGFTRFLNRLGLWRLSFHPVLAFTRR